MKPVEPTPEMMAAIAAEFEELMKPVQARYPGLEVVVCLAMPRPGRLGKHATSVGSTITNVHHIVELLVHSARDVTKRKILS
jgi:hypothetical protein